MSGQNQKVVVIFNGCFWLATAFRYSRVSDRLSEDVVQSILVLGVIALAVNALYLILRGYG